MVAPIKVINPGWTWLEIRIIKMRNLRVKVMHGSVNISPGGSSDMICSIHLYFRFHPDCTGHCRSILLQCRQTAAEMLHTASNICRQLAKQCSILHPAGLINHVLNMQEHCGSCTFPSFWKIQFSSLVEYFPIYPCICMQVNKVD